MGDRVRGDGKSIQPYTLESGVGDEPALLVRAELSDEDEPSGAGIWLGRDWAESCQGERAGTTGKDSNGAGFESIWDLRWTS